MRQLSRRDVLHAGGTALLGFASAKPGLAALMPTPPQIRGPFYPTELPLDRDNDLVAVTGRTGQASGTITHVVGRVLDRAGRPVRDCLIEIWQCDANGRYRHPGDRGDGPRDSNFQGYGRFVTGAAGTYRFRTIRPVPYGWRAPHIHFAVKPPGLEPLVTQMYIAGEPRNESDGLLNRLDGAARDRLLVALEPFTEGEAGSLVGQFDIVLGRDPPLSDG